MHESSEYQVQLDFELRATRAYQLGDKQPDILGASPQSGLVSIAHTVQSFSAPYLFYSESVISFYVKNTPNVRRNI